MIATSRCSTLIPAKANMNRILLICLLVFLSCQSARAETFLPFDGPRPLAVLLETNPWAMVIGADTPDFALYEDGQVIYKNKSSKTASVYMRKLLTADELQKLKAEIAALGPFRTASKFIEVAEVSDQPESKLYLNFQDAQLATSIYGLKFADMPRSEGRSKTPLPAALRKLHALLSSIQFEGATEWRPARFEVIAWDYGYAPDPSIIWPKHLPGLNSPTTIKKETRYSIFVAGSEFENIKAFLSSRKERAAVEIDGRKFMVSVRPVFPGEPVWRNAFAD